MCVLCCCAVLCCSVYVLLQWVGTGQVGLQWRKEQFPQPALGRICLCPEQCACPCCVRITALLGGLQPQALSSEPPEGLASLEAMLLVKRSRKAPMRTDLISISIFLRAIRVNLMEFDGSFRSWSKLRVEATPRIGC